MGGSATSCASGFEAEGREGEGELKAALKVEVVS